MSTCKVILPKVQYIFMIKEGTQPLTENPDLDNSPSPGSSQNTLPSRYLDHTNFQCTLSQHPPHTSTSTGCTHALGWNQICKAFKSLYKCVHNGGTKLLRKVKVTIRNKIKQLLPCHWSACSKKQDQT